MISVHPFPLMQFGYVTCFSVCWFLAPLPAFINNIFEMRGDAFKFLYSTRRPVPREDSGIGEVSTTLNGFGRKLGLPST